VGPGSPSGRAALRAAIVDPGGERAEENADANGSFVDGDGEGVADTPFRQTGVFSVSRPLDANRCRCTPTHIQLGL